MSVDPVDFYILDWGIVHATVCTSLPIRKATDRLNAELPTGIASRWAKAKGAEFAKVQGMKCAELPGHRHYLFNC